ncbi:MAG: MerR family transcriptional regulator [Micrococcales bacterium]|nr:MerR family transcriptional regulator [Micrococcales bacterium]
MTIGSVLKNLQDEFPDISISKIRFLEAEGLVTPERTPSGYRTFTAKDVERLRFILTAQRDRFWPLKVIREALDAMDRGLTDPGAALGERPRPPAPADDPDLPGAEALAAPPELRLTRAELMDSAGLDDRALESLITFGLLRASADGHFDDAALAIAHASAALARFGLEPRHLRPFRTAADREIGLVQFAAGAPRASEEELAARTAEVLRQCLALHTALVKAGLRAGS